MTTNKIHLTPRIVARIKRGEQFTVWKNIVSGNFIAHVSYPLGEHNAGNGHTPEAAIYNLEAALQTSKGRGK